MSVRLVTPNSFTSEVKHNIESELVSCHFMESLIPCAVASVLNRRCEFDCKYFRIKQMKNEEYILFRSTVPKDHCVYILCASIPKIRVLIKQKQLKSLFILVEDKATSNVLEAFSFNLTYQNSRNRICKNASALAAKFFGEINKIPDTMKHSQENIKIDFGFQFYDTMPKELFDEYCDADQSFINSVSRIQSITTLNTNFHSLSLFHNSQTISSKIIAIQQVDDDVIIIEDDEEEDVHSLDSSTNKSLTIDNLEQLAKDPREFIANDIPDKDIDLTSGELPSSATNTNSTIDVQHGKSPKTPEPRSKAMKKLKKKVVAGLNPTIPSFSAARKTRMSSPGTDSNISHYSFYCKFLVEYALRQSLENCNFI